MKALITPINTWFLVANAAHARIFQRADGGPVTELRRFEHPASRLRSAQLGDGKAGHEPGGRGVGGSPFAPHLPAHRKEHLRFAQELAQHLEARAGARDYQRLWIFASDPFLGEVRQLLGNHTRDLLAGARPVDLTHVGPAEMARRIDREIA